METSEMAAIPSRVEHWMQVVQMAGGTTVSPRRDKLIEMFRVYSEARLRQAIADALAGKQSDADYLREVATGLGPEDAARVRRIAAAIDKPSWLDVREAPAPEVSDAEG